MFKNFWLVKQEPEAYSWENFVADKGADWTGIRNYQARNFLREMKKGEVVFFYHSVSEKRVVGIATVQKEHFPDPTAEEGDWSAVRLKPLKGCKRAVPLEEIKADAALKNILLVRHSRLSVMPLSAREAERMLELAETKL